MNKDAWRSHGMWTNWGNRSPYLFSLSGGLIAGKYWEWQLLSAGRGRKELVLPDSIIQAEHLLARCNKSVLVSFSSQSLLAFVISLKSTCHLATLATMEGHSISLSTGDEYETWERYFLVYSHTFLPGRRRKKMHASTPLLLLSPSLSSTPWCSKLHS